MSQTVTPLMAKERLERWCAAEDRCNADARNKLFKWHIYGADQDDIITDLILDGFLNEERYARAFVRGKFRMKRWGRVKIRQHLKQKKISEYCIQAGLQEIDENEYLESLKAVLEKKFLVTKAKNKWDLKQKLFRFAAQRGYENELISNQLSEIIKDE